MINNKKAARWVREIVQRLADEYREADVAERSSGSRTNGPSGYLRRLLIEGRELLEELAGE